MYTLGHAFLPRKGSSGQANAGDGFAGNRTHAKPRVTSTGICLTPLSTQGQAVLCGLARAGGRGAAELSPRTGDTGPTGLMFTGGSEAPGRLSIARQSTFCAHRVCQPGDGSLLFMLFTFYRQSSDPGLLFKAYPSHTSLLSHPSSSREEDGAWGGRQDLFCSLGDGAGSGDTALPLPAWDGCPSLEASPPAEPACP